MLRAEITPEVLHRRQGTMRAECRAEHLGRTTQVWAATVFGGDRKLALFRCTQLVLW